MGKWNNCINYEIKLYIRFYVQNTTNMISLIPVGATILEMKMVDEVGALPLFIILRVMGEKIWGWARHQ